ncbi:PaaI family thioesterase [Rhodococcus rhodochrous]|uniref:PaaI family thioesterase n=1 Tax=Rhodococcus rhodochrous TaxID=1829 RepID=UPI001E48E2C5|nr:PaaI family thioesterase [Rhodococcus rhodochrous]MCB8913998.1 PaaI family thioesterase [Rhodococcus rhodochrous]
MQDGFATSNAGFLEWANRLPMATSFGVKCVEVEFGRTVMEVAEAPFLPNPNGAVHGGIVSAIIDHAMGVTLLSALPRRNAAVTASLTVNYLAPAVVPLVIETRVTKSTRSLMFAESLVMSGDILVDQATGTFVPRTDFLLPHDEAPADVAFYAIEHPEVARSGALSPRR